jgi:hypothetical protein
MGYADRCRPVTGRIINSETVSGFRFLVSG